MRDRLCNSPPRSPSARDRGHPQLDRIPTETVATRLVEVCGIPLIHDKTVDEWGTRRLWSVHDRATSDFKTRSVLHPDGVLARHNLHRMRDKQESATGFAQLNNCFAAFALSLKCSHNCPNIAFKPCSPWFLAVLNSFPINWDENRNGNPNRCSLIWHITARSDYRFGAHD
jgi:hypothetical protein